MIRPILAFHEDERWFPVGVEESLAYARVKVPTPDDTRARLNFPEMTPPALSPVAYHRIVRGGGLFWHQYWFWYLYNPKQWVGMGRHEGDWETIQIGCTDMHGTTPILVVAGQHRQPESAPYWTLTKRDHRPLVYIALASHAAYFKPCVNLEDVTGDDRFLSDYEIRPFGPWIRWKGLWGNSTGSGRSPSSPTMQGHRWHAPHRFYQSS